MTKSGQMKSAAESVDLRHQAARPVVAAQTAEARGGKLAHVSVLPSPAAGFKASEGRDAFADRENPANSDFAAAR